MRFLVSRPFSSLIPKIKSLQTSFTNIKPNLFDLIDRKLFEIDRHPLQTLKILLQDFYGNEVHQKSSLQTHFPLPYKFVTHTDPVVSLYQNFESLLIKPDHISSLIIREKKRHFLHQRRGSPSHANLGSSKRAHSGFQRFLRSCRCLSERPDRCHPLSCLSSNGNSKIIPVHSSPRLS